MTYRDLEANLAAASESRPSYTNTPKNDWPKLAQLARAWDAANPERAVRRREILLAMNQIETEMLDLAERARQAETKKSRLMASGAPPRAIDAATNPNPSEAEKAARKWLSGDSSLLLFSGGVGTGKTVAACIAVLEFCRQMKTALFVLAGDAAAFSIFGDEAMARARAWRDSDLLVLDDMGSEFLTDPWLATVDAVVCSRTGARRRTILTTNLAAAGTKDAPGFRERYGARVADRIREDGTIVRLAETSRRGRE